MLLTVGFATASRAQTGPVLEYGFDEGVGVWALDGSVNGLHAPIETTAEYEAPGWGAGLSGSALVFDGNNDVLNVGDHPLLDLDHYTLMAWVRYERSDWFAQEVLEKADAYWMNIRRDSGKLRAGGFYGGCTGESWFYLDSTPVVPEDTWMHVASSYDGSMLRIYLDGVLAAQAPVSGTVCSNSYPLAIGAKHVPGDSAFFFNGTIDEVQLFSRALSEGEVQAAMMPSVPALSGAGRALAALVLLMIGPSLARRGFGVVDRPVAS